MTTTNDETRPVNIPPDDKGQLEDISSSAESATTPVIEEMIVSDKKSRPRRRGCLRAWMMWTLITLLLLCLIAGLSGYAGYKDGLRKRNEAANQVTGEAAQTQFFVAMKEIDAGRFRLLPTRLASFRQWPSGQREISSEVALELQVQFQLAQSDVQEKRYEAARARLEWILEWNSAYPGVTDLLAETLYQMSITATPTLAPTPTPVPATPTPDTRDVDKLFSDAQQAYMVGHWTLAIETLLTLRKHDATYKTVQVDDMLYVSLRYRGLDKIKGSGKTDATITQVDLEGGMYDLGLAEKFGPLDAEAVKYRRWAQWYIAGASFWNVDWKQVVDYFALVANEDPYLMDVNNWPAIERYLYALGKYGDQLAAAGDCAGASEQYQKALNLSANSSLEATATAVANGCGSSKPKVTPVVKTPVVITPSEATPTSPPVVNTAVPTPTTEATTPSATRTPTNTPKPENPTNTPTTKPENPTNTPTTEPENPTNTPTPKPENPTNTPTTKPENPTKTPTP